MLVCNVNIQPVHFIQWLCERLPQTVAQPGFPLCGVHMTATLKRSFRQRNLDDRCFTSTCPKSTGVSTTAGQQFSKPPSRPSVPTASPSTQAPSSPLPDQSGDPSETPLENASQQPGTSTAHMHRHVSDKASVSSQLSQPIVLPQLQQVDLQNVEQVC